jgi:hypothetical protein
MFDNYEKELLYKMEKNLALKIIYDRLCRVLTKYEEGEYGAEELYSMLVDIQNLWENLITAE